MSHHLRNDLERLQRRLLDLGARVEDAVRKSLTALETRRADLALEVMGGDIEIDQAEVEIEEDCLKVLALHQPVATDLRCVAVTLKINNDLERIGDLAVNIAERSASLKRALPFPVGERLQVGGFADAIGGEGFDMDQLVGDHFSRAFGPEFGQKVAARDCGVVADEPVRRRLEMRIEASGQVPDMDMGVDDPERIGHDKSPLRSGGTETARRRGT